MSKKDGQTMSQGHLGRVGSLKVAEQKTYEDTTTLAGPRFDKVYQCRTGNRHYKLLLLFFFFFLIFFLFLDGH